MPVCACTDRADDLTPGTAGKQLEVTVLTSPDPYLKGLAEVRSSGVTVFSWDMAGL